MAIVAEQLTQTLLLDVQEELAPDQDIQADTLTEVVARVRHEIRRESDATVAAAETAASARVATAESRAGRAEEGHRQLVIHLQSGIDRWATRLANGAFVVLFVVLVTGTAFGLKRNVPLTSTTARVALWSAFALVTAFGVYRATWGGNLVQVRQALREWLRATLSKRFLPHS